MNDTRAPTQSPGVTVEDRQTGHTLLDCLRHGPRPAMRERLRALGEAEWQTLAERAQGTGLAPLLYYRLAPLGAGVAPAAVARQLSACFVATWARAEAAFRERAVVLRAFADARIPVIVLKGAYLAEHVYESIALRPMGDTDLMVRMSDLPRTATILEALGYPPSVAHQEADAHTHHLRFAHAEHGASIEMHWCLVNDAYAFSVDTDGLWLRARPTTCAGIPALTLSPEDLLLHLCVHNASHAFGVGPRALVDVDYLIRRRAAETPRTVDWSLFLERAHAWKVEKGAYVTLALTHDHLGTPVPGAVTTALSPPSSDITMVEVARQQVLRAGAGAMAIAPRFIQVWSDRPVREKLRIVVDALCPRRQLMAMLYPPAADSLAIFLYYPVRWVTLLRVYSRAVWALVRKHPQAVATAAAQNDVATLRDWLLNEPS